MFLTTGLTAAIEMVLKQAGAFAGPVLVTGIAASGLSECYQVITGGRPYFLKVNDARKYPHMFDLEALGLRQLKAASVVRVPEVIGSGMHDGMQFLLLEWVEGGRSTAAVQRDLGRRLARLHRVSSPSFGLDFDNFIGTLIQRNEPKTGWTDFFMANRLQPLVDMAESNGLIDCRICGKFDRLYDKLDGLYPQEPAALLHGDLWSGNFMVAAPDEPVLIDPAVYFGHRETDLAMTTLFGGFDAAFYGAYQDEYPLEPGWQDRMQLWNLYPLLVHLNLFGAGYRPDIVRTLDLFAGR